MFEKEIDRILKILPKELEGNPRAIKKVLAIATDALDRYEELLDKERNALAQNAIRDVLHFSNDSPTLDAFGIESVPHMIDAMYFNFPHGRVQGHSPAEQKAFYRFREHLINGDFLDSSWLKTVKGAGYYKWAQKVVESKTKN